MVFVVFLRTYTADLIQRVSSARLESNVLRLHITEHNPHMHKRRMMNHMQASTERLAEVQALLALICGPGVDPKSLTQNDLATATPLASLRGTVGMQRSAAESVALKTKDAGVKETLAAIQGILMPTSGDLDALDIAADDKPAANIMFM